MVEFHTEDGVVKAVDGLNLEVKHAETVGLVGESGSGKSVTALAIMQLVAKPMGKITKGEIVFEAVVANFVKLAREFKSRPDGQRTDWHKEQWPG